LGRWVQWVSGFSSFLFMLGFHRDLSNKLKITWIGGDLIPKSGFKHELWFVFPYVVSFCACILPVVDQGFFCCRGEVSGSFPHPSLHEQSLCGFSQFFFSAVLWVWVSMVLISKLNILFLLTSQKIGGLFFPLLSNNFSFSFPSAHIPKYE